MSDQKLAALAALASAITAECLAEDRAVRVSEEADDAFERMRDADRRDREVAEVLEMAANTASVDVDLAEKRLALATKVRREVQTLCEELGAIPTRRTRRKGGPA